MLPEKNSRPLALSDPGGLFLNGTEQNSLKAPKQSKSNEIIPISMPHPKPNKESRMTYYKNEILAGIIVGFVLVPQECAFSFIGGLDPSIGIHAAWINGIITAIFGGRPAMINGFTGGVASLVNPLLLKDKNGKASGKGVEELFLATIMAGVIIAVCGALKLGRFQVVIPATVKVGFCNGLAIIIGNSI